MNAAAFYTVRRAEEPSSANGGDRYAQRDDVNTQQNGHPTNTEDLYSTVNKTCEYWYYDSHCKITPFSCMNGCIDIIYYIAHLSLCNINVPYAL